MKRLIFVYSNSEFYLNVEKIMLIKYTTGYEHRMEIGLENGFKVDVADFQKTFDFQDMMKQLNDAKGDVCKYIKCRSLICDRESCNIVVEDWVRQATG